MASELIVQTLKGPTSGANANKILIPSGQTLNAAGHVVAVYNAVSDTTQTISSASLTNISGLSITMTPKDADNLIVMQASIQNTMTYVTSYAFLKDGAKTQSGRAGTNRSISDVQTVYYWGTTSTGYVMNTPIMHYETAGSTSSRNYTVAAASSWDGAASTMYVNDRGDGDMQGYSYFTIWEIAQ